MSSGSERRETLEEKSRVRRRLDCSILAPAKDGAFYPAYVSQSSYVQGTSESG